MNETSILDSRAGRVTLVMAAHYIGFGMALPFLSRWLEDDRGLHGAQIGAVLSLAQLARIGTGPLIAAWADSVADRRTPIRMLSIGALLSYLAFFLVADNFAALLALGFLALTLSQAMVPFVEAATLRACDQGRLPYGLARGLGSSAFILANVLGGIAIARFGAGAVVVWVLSGYTLLLVTAWTRLPSDPAPPQTHEGSALAARWQSVKLLLRTRSYMLVIVSCGLIQGAHAFYYGFSTLAWRTQGLSADIAGWLWGVAVGAEVALLWSLTHIERRFSPEALILLGGAGAVLRWVIAGFGPTGALLWTIQLLHALSFAATHVGAMRLIYRDAPESAAGMAQTLYAALSSGLLMGLSMLLSGALYDAFGLHAYWAMAGLALAGVLVAAPLVMPKPVSPKG